MPSLDTTRVAFVKQPYRYQIVSDAAVKADFPNAQEIQIDTNLAASDASALATTYFNLIKTFPQVYEVEIEAAIHLEDFVTTVPHYTVSFPAYSTDGRTFKLVSVSTDYLADRSTLVIRG